MESVMEYIKEKGFKFDRLDSIEKLGQGGESTIYRLIPYLPVEIIAKLPLIEL
jgi:hypothetical protein